METSNDVAKTTSLQRLIKDLIMRRCNDVVLATSSDVFIASESDVATTLERFVKWKANIDNEIALLPKIHCIPKLIYS